MPNAGRKMRTYNQKVGCSKNNNVSNAQYHIIIGNVKSFESI